jgi:hypothetical protein
MKTKKTKTKKTTIKKQKPLSRASAGKFTDELVELLNKGSEKELRARHSEALTFIMYVFIKMEGLSVLGATIDTALDKAIEDASK